MTELNRVFAKINDIINCKIEVEESERLKLLEYYKELLKLINFSC